MRNSCVKAFLVLAVFLCQSVMAVEKIKIACIGDSITFGVGASNRREMSYPAQLQKRLGDGYVVGNFGTSGIEMTNYLKKWQQKLEDFQPDIVTIKLGTNDTKGRRFETGNDNKEQFNESFADAAANLISFLEGLKSKPRIYICLPVPVFKDKWKINEKALIEDVIPSLKKLAKEKGLPIIDLYTPCKDKGDSVPDGIHPNEKVYAVIAEIIAKEIAPNRPNTQ